jgi:ketopantoate reductase
MQLVRPLAVAFDGWSTDRRSNGNVVRVLVFGAGPLGSLMAARLHEAGHEVSLLARGQRLADLENHGVVLQDEASGEQEVAHVPLVEIRGDMDAWLKYHACVTILALGPALCAAGIDVDRLARTRDLMILSLRAMKEGFRGLREQLDIPPAPKSFRLLELLPEPIWVWLLRSRLRTGEARASIEGHSAAARDEIEHVAGELLAQLHAAGAATPSVDRLLPYADPATPTWPDGAREIPMRWGGLVVPALVLAALVTAARIPGLSARTVRHIALPRRTR